MNNYYLIRTNFIYDMSHLPDVTCVRVLLAGQNITSGPFCNDAGTRFTNPHSTTSTQFCKEYSNSYTSNYQVTANGASIKLLFLVYILFSLSM